MRTSAAIFPESVHVDYRKAWAINAWALVAVMVAGVSRRVLADESAFGGWGRAAVALAPLVPGLLYVRTVWRWIAGLDEMQRRLQVRAVGFAASTLLLVAVGMDLLRGASVMTGLALGWEGYFAAAFGLWVLGLAMANRDYR